MPSLDLKDLVNYKRLVDLAKDKHDTYLRRYLNKMCNMVLARAIPITPVDTGTLRRSWHVTDVQLNGDEYTITVFNDATQSSPVSYASFVEYGHMTVSGGWVEGRFMLTTSIDYVKSIMGEQWELEFRKFVQEVGL